MKKILRKNQVVISALAVMIAVAGYLTYAGKDGVQDTKGTVDSGNSQTGGTYASGDFDISIDDILAENNAVDQSVANNEDVQAGANNESKSENESNNESKEESVANNDNSQDVNQQSPGEAVLTSGMTVADFLAQVKLNREQVRGKNKDALLEIVNNDAISSEEKQNAINSMVELTEIADRENAAETLLKANGFNDAIVSIVNGQADVVICQSEITDAQRAQIEDIVKRKTELGAESIVITLMELKK